MWHLQETHEAPNHGCPLKIAKKEQQPPAFFTGSNWSTVTWWHPLQAFHPSKDELTRRLSDPEIVVDGEKLVALEHAMVEDSLSDHAKVQVQTFAKSDRVWGVLRCSFFLVLTWEFTCFLWGWMVFSFWKTFESITISRKVWSHMFCTLQVVFVNATVECASKELSGRKVKDLRGVRIPDTETRIRPFAFEGCRYLFHLEIPESVTEIGHHAFRDCSSLLSVNIPKSVTKLADYAFAGCSSLTNLTIPESVTELGYRALNGCSSLTSLTLPSVTHLGYDVFSGCSSLTNLAIPSATRIGFDLFSGCSSLTSLTIPNRATGLGGRAFSGCSSLTSLTIPRSVTEIQNSTFADCSSLTTLTIPSSVSSIGADAFRGCISLTTLTIPTRSRELETVPLTAAAHWWLWPSRTL